MSDCDWDGQIEGKTAKLNTQEWYIKNVNSTYYVSLK
jgi:hypothetical protein